MIKAYMLAAPPLDGAMYTLGSDKIEFVNTFKVGEKDGKDIVVVVCEDAMLESLMAMPEYLGGNDADLALRRPDIAKLIFMVDVKDKTGATVEVAYGDITGDMVILSPVKEPIVIMGEEI